MNGGNPNVGTEQVRSDGSAASADAGAGPTSRLLYRPDDSVFLSDLYCFLRRHVEAFVVSAPDGNAVADRRTRLAGRMGLRCVHCAHHEGGWQRIKGAATFPKSIRLVYQAVRNWQRYHLLECPVMPQEDKDRFLELKNRGRSRSGNDAPRHWEESCCRMGMIDAEDGIRLRNGRFDVDGGDDGSHEVDNIVAVQNEGPLVTKKKLVAMAGGPDILPPDGNGKEESCGIDEKPVEASINSSNESVAVTLSLSPSRPSNHIGYSSASLSKEAVLERVQLALDSVQAVGLIRQIPLTPPSPTERASVVSFQTNQHEEQDACDMRSLGAQLYELFSGRILPDDTDVDTGGDETLEDSSDASGTAQGSKGANGERKRERRPGRFGFVPLSDLGLPSQICSLVSSLIDPSSGGNYCTSYGSFGDVVEDLRLMASEPEKYLFHVANGHFQIDPSALYGRERESSKLLEAYDCVTDPFGTRTREMVLLTGYSGTGKSAIVESVRDRLIRKGACFVSGKFDAMQQLKPLSAVMSAIDDYCGLLANDGDRIDGVREAVSSGIVGSEGRVVLANLIPNLARIVDHAEDSLPATQVHGRDALQRILFMIRKLFQATCSYAYPVVLFLDDLQWADEMSLLLLEALALDSMIEGLLFIGCYRDNEVGADHLLTKHLAAIRRSGTINITSFCIGNLDLNGVSSLLADALHLTPRTTRSLAKVVLHKTGGNALFVVQFLGSLCDESLLYFSLSSRRWEWDIGAIWDKDIADDVVGLMTAKFRSMTPEVLEALQVSAALGAQCQGDLLSIIDRAPDRVGSTAAALDVAAAEGIMNKVGSAYRFAHDQIQRAAYLLIPESNRQAFHFLIGRFLWKYASEEELETYLFVVVDQLHRGRSVITDHDEKVALAWLSLLAGEMASTMSAFLPASAYLNAGVGLLVNEDWHCHRGLCVDLHNLCVETEYILGNFDLMQGLINKILSMGKTLQEKLRAYHTLVLSLSAQGRITDAINTASSVLCQLGETLPATSSTAKEEIGMTMCALSTEDENSLFHLKTMENALTRDKMRTLHAVLLCTYNGWPSYFPVVVCRMVRISLSHGVCKESALGFAFYGVLSCVALGRFSEGYRFGKLALNIIDRFQAQEHFAKVYGVVYGVVSHWSEPSQSTLPPLKRAIDIGLATGDTEYAMVAAHLRVAISFASGVALGPLAEEMKMYSNQMLEYKQHRIYMNSKVIHQSILNLLGRSADATKLVGEEMDECSLPDSVEDSGYLLFLTTSFRMWLEYMFGEYQLAWCTVKSQAELKSNDKRVLIPLSCYNTLYSCLAALELARAEGENEYLATIDETMTQMTTWASATTWNCQNKLELMKAEHAYLKGDLVSAAKCYNLAIDLAVKHHFIHEQALALERFGIFRMETGDHETASGLLTRARECYSKWGAVRKVAHIDEQYGL